MSGSDVILTPDGAARIRAELERLRRVRGEAVERARAAMAHGGGPAGNGELHEAREEQGRVEARIRALEDRLAVAEVVEPDLTDGRLGVGERVRARDLDSGAVHEFRVVGTAEADPAAGSISHRSPVGAALLDRRAGDVVQVDVPGGRLRLEVLEVDI